MRDYPTLSGPKALAIGTRGDAVWGAMAGGATTEEAIRRALEFCGYRSGSGGAASGSGSGNPTVAGGRTGPCILYAVGRDLVTLPPKSRRIIGVLVLSTDHNIPASDRARLVQDYAKGDWQAVARGRGGTWHAVSGGGSESAAVDAALGKCKLADMECQVYAIGRFLVASD